VAEAFWGFLRLMDEKGREDKVFLLAGGVAFNLLLALIPLLVITITATALLLGKTPSESTTNIVAALGSLFPVGPEVARIIEERMSELLGNATTTVSVGTVALIWLSTRLFGSLRGVLADVFDIEETRNIITGKLFDIRMTLISSVFLMSYFVITAYLAIVTTRERVELARTGLREELITGLEYWLGRLLAFAVIMLTFFLLYRYLPRKRIRWRTALVAALFASLMIEIARHLFGQFSPSLELGNLYTGVVLAIIVCVAWSYYVALIFILGGEIAQVYDLRRARKIQRVVFE
jgi:membrane protein